MDTKKTRGKGRGRGRGGRGRGRGKKATRIISSDDEETPQETVEEIVPEENIVAPQIETPAETVPIEEENNKENEPQTKSIDDNIELPGVNMTPQHTIDMEADISQLEAPTFTTLSKRPPEPMLHLKWDHKVSLIGEKVLNPMIHCCDQCDKPILVYGRMIPCKHVFCLKCARAEPIKNCPRCKDKVTRVEQSGLGTVFMCIHGGSRYGSTGCRRTYLSQRDLQAHINHRHVTQPPLPPVGVDKTSIDTKNLSRKIIDPNISLIGQTQSVSQQNRSQNVGQITSPSICKTQSSIEQPRSMSNTPSTGTNQISSSSLTRPSSTINPSIQEAQHSMSKISIQQQHTQPQIPMQHVSAPPPPMTPMVAAYYSTTYQPSYAIGANTYSAPTMQPIMTQNYGTISSVQPPPQPPPPMGQMPMQANPMQLPPAAWQFGQMQPSHYGQFDPNSQAQPWNPQQQYFR